MTRMVGMWRVLASIGCVLAGTAFAEAPPPARGQPALVEEVVAVVRGPGAPKARIVTLTRLEEEARIALVSRGAIGAAVAPLDRAALRAALVWLVDQTLLGDEAARLQVFEVEQADLDAEVQRSGSGSRAPPTTAPSSTGSSSRRRSSPGFSGAPCACSAT